MKQLTQCQTAVCPRQSGLTIAAAFALAAAIWSLVIVASFFG